MKNSYVPDNKDFEPIPILLGYVKNNNSTISILVNPRTMSVRDFAGRVAGVRFDFGNFSTVEAARIEGELKLKYQFDLLSSDITIDKAHGVVIIDVAHHRNNQLVLSENSLLHKVLCDAIAKSGLAFTPTDEFFQNKIREIDSALRRDLAAYLADNQQSTFTSRFGK